MEKTEEHYIGKGTATSPIQFQCHESNNYYEEHMWSRKEEHAIKQSRTAKKKETGKNGETSQSTEEDQLSESDGESSSSWQSEESWTPSETDSQESISDTMSGCDRLEFDPPLSYMGTWNMNGGTGVLVLEKVKPCGSCIQNTIPKNSTSGGMGTKMKKSSQLKSGLRKTNVLRRF